MTPLSIWPSLAIFALALVFVTPDWPWRFLDSPQSQAGSRNVSLDGLRGFLALAVVLHHASITYGFIQTGVWQLPPSSYYALLGQVGVSLFFMITAVLFWGRLLDEGPRINWLALYGNRFFRIAPLYLVAVGFMFAIVAYRTQFRLAVSFGELSGQVFHWILPGLTKSPSPINGYGTPSLILAGVAWTLYYEWLFYISLPFLAIAALRRSVLSFIPAIAWLYVYSPTVFSDMERYFVALFACGMFAASMVRRYPQLCGDNSVKSLVGISLLIALFASSKTAYAWGPIALLGAFFLLVSSGTTFFGLLASRGAIRLGNISYGTYLLQGLVLQALFSPRTLGQLALRGAQQYWLVVLLLVLVLVLVAAATYQWVEKPGIRFGKRIVQRHAQKATPVADPDHDKQTLKSA
ncbi:acyltransferase family protein [Cupriavidus sp. CuC1]|uniref:acyltransferase family protein n=1 Tax=Cupriavidus sp. CuC1 TaxID=3373131 RepID=UPI0037D3E239